jgi:hypothetical protein
MSFGDDRVEIFLMRFVGAKPAHENREQIWCDLDGALERSTFPESRELLKMAQRLITAKT